MFLNELKGIKSTAKEVKNFSRVISIALFIVSGIALYKQSSVYLILLCIGAAVLLLGFTSWKILIPLQKLWMGISVIIGFFMSRIILSIVFFGVMTPLSLVFRLSGKKFLNLNFRTDANTYWEPKESNENQNYEKQY